MMGEEQGELVERLVALGLDEREAKLYLHLALAGPSRASDAAAATRLKRTETYRALDGLMRRGFVTAHLAKPVVYEANAPASVFSDLLASHEERGREIEKLRERVTTAISAAQAGAGKETGRHSYKIVQGRRAIFQHVETMLRRAERSVAVASTSLGPATFASPNRAWSTLARRAKDGVPTRVMARSAPGLAEGLQDLLTAPDIRVRTFDPAGPTRFVLVDEKEVAFWLVNDPASGMDGRDDVAMWTNAPDFVLAQGQLFEALWRDAKPVS